MTPIEGNLAAIALATAGPVVGLGLALVSLVAVWAMTSVTRWLMATPIRGGERDAPRSHRRTPGRPASAWPAD
jgi:hypothetical protein